MHTTPRRLRLSLPVVLPLLALVIPTPALAQDADSRWLPWTGCWKTPEDAQALLCVERVAEGIEFLAVDTLGAVLQETIVADGTRQPLDLEGCEGVRSAEFSKDGERIYLRDEIDCNGTRDVITGVIAMIVPEEWIDIRGTLDGQRVWSRTFVRVSDEVATGYGFPDANDPDDLSMRLLRWRASEPSDFDDLIEVHQRTGVGVTRAWVAEQLDPFPVEADALVRIAEAGVSESVIDVVVAKAFPERFAVSGERAPRDDSSDPRPARSFTYLDLDPFYGLYGSPHTLNSRRFGHGFGSHFGGFGSHFGGGFFHDQIVVVRVRDSGARGSSGVRPNPGGGYVRRGEASGNGRFGRDRTNVGASASSGVSSSARSTGRTARRTGGGGG